MRQPMRWGRARLFRQAPSQQAGNDQSLFFQFGPAQLGRSLYARGLFLRQAFGRRSVRGLLSALTE